MRFRDSGVNDLAPPKQPWIVHTDKRNPDQAVIGVS